MDGGPYENALNHGKEEFKKKIKKLCTLSNSVALLRQQDVKVKAN